MPIQLNWHTEPEIVYSAYRGSITVDELANHTQHLVMEYLEHGHAQRPVHVLVDWREIGKYPLDLAMLHQLTNWMLAHPALGRIVFFGIPAHLAAFSATLLHSLYGARLHICKTQQEAEAYLQHVAQSKIA
jgi:hypothetical protein